MQPDGRLFNRTSWVSEQNIYTVKGANLSCFHPCVCVCVQVVRSQQLRSAAVREGDSGPRKKEEEDEKEKREQERQLNKEKLHTWKVLSCVKCV